MTKGNKNAFKNYCAHRPLLMRLNVGTSCNIVIASLPVNRVNHRKNGSYLLAILQKFSITLYFSKSCTYEHGLIVKIVELNVYLSHVHT